MPSFRFRARNADGTQQTGFVEAKDHQDAHYRIEGRGLQVISIEPAVLKKQRPPPQVRIERPPHTKRNVSIVLILLLALATFYYFDPLEIRRAFDLP